jgi:Na+-translocating ferredoxin:NAD+ oxidoreductase RnfD subunit
MGKHTRRTGGNSRHRSINQFIKTPKGFVLILLSFLSLVSIFATRGVDLRALFNVILAVITGIGFDLIVGMFYKKKRFFSDGGVLTGLIIAMVLSSFTTWYITVVTTIIALLSKHVIKMKRKPVFNPAAFGLLVSSYLFASMQSWWGGMSLLSTWFLIVLCVSGLWVTRRVKKFSQVISFLASYAIVCVILMLFKQTHSNALYAVENPMLNAALFLAFFMLTDPPTSPAKRRDQIWFGAITGVLSVAIYMIFPAELSYLLIALLTANLFKFIHTQWMTRSIDKRKYHSVSKTPNTLTELPK